MGFNALRHLVAVSAASVALSFAALPSLAADNTLRFAFPEDVSDWHPGRTVMIEGSALANMYEQLVYTQPDGSIRPGLASEWSVDESGTIWTFKLREGVTFHDGAPFNSAAVKASIERTRELPGFGFIWLSVTDIGTPDDLMVTITTEFPVNLLGPASSMWGAFMYSPDATEEQLASGDASYGTGPYYLRLYSAGQRVVLDRNPDYWGDHPENGFDRVVINLVQEPSTRMQMISSGEADIVTDIPVDQIESVDSNPDYTVNAFDSLEYRFWYINHKVAPTDNIHVRKAIELLWDRDTIAQGIYNGTSRPMTSVFPSNMDGAPEVGYPAFDIEAAKAELENSGLSPEELTITVGFTTALDDLQNSAILFQQNAAKAGLTVELVPNDMGTLFANARDEATATNMLSQIWWPAYNSFSDTLYTLFYSGERLWNLSMYENSEFDGKLFEGLQNEAFDMPAAIASYDEAMDILRDDVAALFDQETKFIVAVENGIEGLNYNPYYNRYFYFNEMSR